MPGVSHRGDVPGAFGVGKIRLKFYPKGSRSKRSYIGWVVIIFTVCSIIFSVTWVISSSFREFMIPQIIDACSFADLCELIGLDRKIQSAEVLHGDEL